MPHYDFACLICGHKQITYIPVYEEREVVCKECKSKPMRKLYTAPGVVFKGTGWASKE